MPSIASKVKGLLTKPLVKDIPSDCTTTYPIQSNHNDTKTDDNGRLSSRGLPTQLIERIPWEIYELILHLFRCDLPALRTCCLVCQDWKAVSQPLLFRCLLRPRRLISSPGFKFDAHVNCAVIHDPTNVVLYGTSRGIFWQSMNHADEPPVEVVGLEDVQQMNIINIAGKPSVIFRTGRLLYRALLEDLAPARSSTKLSLRGEAWWAAMEYYALGTASGMDVIALVRDKEITLIQYSAPIDEYIWFMSYRVEERPASVHFIYGKIITILPLKGFHVTDIRELTTSMLPRVEFTIEEEKAGLALAKTLSVVATPATNGEFSLLCYDRYGVYMDGDRTLYEPFTVWCYPAQRIAFQDYFALVLSKNHLEIHHLIKRKQLQLVPGKFQILSAHGTRRIIVMRTDGEIFEFVGDPTA